MIKISAIAIIAGAWSLPTQAQMVSAQDPGSVVQALSHAGYEARLVTDTQGDPAVVTKVAGTTFHIFFFNCTSHKACATVEFYSGYDLPTGFTLDGINAWNRKERFGRAFLDDENDPIVEMDVDLDDGGMSPSLFIDNVEFWATIMNNFERSIGYRK